MRKALLSFLAAAAVACVAGGNLDNAGALRAMKAMGTGEQYLGLWASAREARPVDTAAMPVTFREIAPVPPIQEAMVHLDEALEALALARAKPAVHPDVDPPHEAPRAREILTEILRTEEFAARPADDRAWMKALETKLRARAPEESLDAAYARVRKSCAECHKPYRNAPKRK